MNLSQLRAFHAVGSKGSFTAAARAMGVSQPTLSGQVAALERTYGVRLFERSPRGISLTATGEALLRVAERLFANETDAEQLLSATIRLQRGSLKAGADGPHHIIPVLGAFSRMYPGVELSLVMGNSDRVVRALRAGRIDVAITARLDHDSALFSRQFRRSEVVLFVPRTHAWARRSTVDLREVAAERMILREAASITRQVVQSAFDREGVRPQSVMEIESREAVREAVAAGLGIGVVSLAEFDRDPRLKALRIRGGRLAIVEHVVCMQERRNNSVVRAFLELAGGFADERGTTSAES